MILNHSLPAMSQIRLFHLHVVLSNCVFPARDQYSPRVSQGCDDRVCASLCVVDAVLVLPYFPETTGFGSSAQPRWNAREPGAYE